MARKRSLKTSQEVCSKLRWHPDVGVGRAAVVYRDRFDAEASLGLRAFLDGGIPWTRVVRVLLDERVVWDRERRLDLIYGSGESSAEDRISLRAGPEAVAGLDSTRYVESEDTWFFDVNQDAQPVGLSLATLNVLYDLHQPELLYTEERIPALLDALRATDADVICLQEVTPKVLAHLLEAPWIRAEYACSDDGSGSTVTPDGPLLLSRLPLHDLRVVPLSERKRVLLAELKLAGGPLQLACVHFTSNRARDAERKRAAEAARVLELLGGGDALVAGDFNTRDPAPPLEGFVDAWSRAGDGSDGFTYEPASNGLAKTTTVSGKPARYDRVLLRSEQRAFRSARRFAREPFAPDRFVSDHCGLRVELALGTDARPTYRSALVVSPPERASQAIQVLRREHDKGYRRWPPHVNLLYGFVPQASFPAALPALRAALATVEPFTVTLSRFRSFRHRRSATIWLEPECDPPGALRRLQRLLEQAFPQCDEQGKKSEHGFTPHLSVGQAPPADVDARVAEFQGGWEPVRFVVSEVQLIAREKDAPFRVHDTVHLGGGGWLDDEQVVRAAIQRALGDMNLHVSRVGSRALDAALPRADLDLVCVGSHALDRRAFFDRVGAALDDDGFSARVVPARVPVLTFPGVELLYAQLPRSCAPAPAAELPQDVVDSCDPTSRAALLAARDAAAILDHVRGREETFSALLLRVRAWARARRLEDPACGMLGGLCWAILAAETLASSDSADPDDLLRQFFARYAEWPWPEPVRLNELPCELAETDRLPILTPSAPSENAARNVTRGTRETLVAELLRARDCDRPRALVLPYTAPTSVVLRVEGLSDPDALAVARGWVRGNALSLVLDLERAGASVRPAPGSLDLNLLLEGGDPARRRKALDAFAERFKAWPERLAGVTLRTQ